MKDYRSYKNTISLKGKRILQSMENNNDNIKILLMNIGINPRDELVNGLKNYLDKNNLNLTMRNIYKFLKNNSIVSNTITATNDKINIINMPIVNMNRFDTNMNEKGYISFTQDFLIKDFNEMTVNIKRDDKTISSIICYDNDNSIIDMPKEIYDIVISDIEQSNI